MTKINTRSLRNLGPARVLKYLSLSALSLSFALNLSAQIAQIATFDFTVSDLSERPSAVFNDAANDINLTITALGNYDWRNGDLSGPNLQLSFDDLVFNRPTSTGNATDGFQMSFSFSKAVRLNNFTIAFGKDGRPSDTDFDDKTLAFTKADGSSLFNLTSANGNFDQNTINDFPSVTVEANTPITLTYFDPNEEGRFLTWDKMTVQVIPEPSTYALWGGLFVTAIAITRTYKRSV
jgi:hypothetical protein